MFKIGDKVRYIGPDWFVLSTGDIGIVIEADTGCLITVSFGSNRKFYGNNYHFVLVTPISKEEQKENLSFWDTVAE
jgi:hypothetical protein